MIMFTKFEEGNIWSETCDNEESGDKYDGDSIMPPLIRKEETDAMDSGDESEYEPMSTEMLEDIGVSSKYNPRANRR